MVGLVRNRLDHVQLIVKKNYMEEIIYDEIIYDEIINRNRKYIKYAQHRRMWKIRRLRRL